MLRNFREPSSVRPSLSKVLVQKETIVQMTCRRSCLRWSRKNLCLSRKIYLIMNNKLTMPKEIYQKKDNLLQKHYRMFKCQKCVVLKEWKEFPVLYFVLYRCVFVYFAATKKNNIWIILSMQERFRLVRPKSCFEKFFLWKEIVVIAGGWPNL